MSSPPTPEPDAVTVVYALAMASLKALKVTVAKLEAARTSADDEHKKAIKTAVTAHEDRVRENYPEVVEVSPAEQARTLKKCQAVYAGRYVEYVQEMAKIDGLKAARKKDIDARTRTINKFLGAVLECESAKAKVDTQVDLFAPPDLGVIQGMEWSTPAGREAIYTSLRNLEVDGMALDPIQAKLFVDMAGSGLEAMDLGLSAAQAVEDDLGGEEESDDDDENDDDMGLD